MKSDKIYLQDILEMIGRIEAATVGGKEAFMASTLHQDAVLHNLHTKTATTRLLSAELKAAHPEVEWTTLSVFRNVLLHDNPGMDTEIVWAVVTADLPDYKARILKILGEMD